MKDGIYCGKDEYGDQYFLEIEIRHKVSERGFETIHHKTIHQIDVLSICGTIYHRNQAEQLGQCIEAFKTAKLTGGVLRPLDFKWIMKAWEKYHLNDMKAGCAHDPEYRRNEIVRPLVYPPPQYDLYNEDPYYWVCPDTTKPSFPYGFGKAYENAHPSSCPEGYIYGTKWLYEEIPKRHLNRIRQLMELHQKRTWEALYDPEKVLPTLQG